MKKEVYNQQGKVAGTVELPEKIFNLPWNADLVHQVIVSMQSNKRAGTAHAKDRGEVRGGGKKPWRQKGTGRARHGSIRSPLWIGGGVTHGPRKDRNYSKKINRKMKRKALFTILSRKLKDGEILLVNDITLKEFKTREAWHMLQDISKVEGYEKLGYKKGKRAIILNPEKDSKLHTSFRNINSVRVLELRNVNPLELAMYQYAVLVNPEESFKMLAINS